MAFESLLSVRRGSYGSKEHKKVFLFKYYNLFLQKSR